MIPTFNVIYVCLAYGLWQNYKMFSTVNYQILILNDIKLFIFLNIMLYIKINPQTLCFSSWTAGQASKKSSWLGRVHLIPGWWQGQLSILERIRPASLVSEPSANPWSLKKKSRYLRCGKPVEVPPLDVEEKKKGGKTLKKQNEWRFPPVFYRLLNEWWIRYCR